MTKPQAILEIKNSLWQLDASEHQLFLSHLLDLFDDPEGWLTNVDYADFRNIIKKHYHKNYKYSKR